jgi:hypothetical protein
MSRVAVLLVLAALLLPLGATSAVAAVLGLSSRTLTVFGKALGPPATCTLVGAPGPSTTLTDTYVRQDTAATSYGTATTLDVDPTTSALRFPLLRFDLTACALPAGANVTSATLRLVLTAAPSAGRQYQVFRAGSSWSESSVTWSTRPSVVSASSTATTLAANLSAAGTSMTVADASVLPAPPFTVTLDSEVIRAGSRSGNVLGSLTRGYFGTAKASHGTGSAVAVLAPTATVATGVTSGATLTANVLFDVQAYVSGTATNYGWRLDDADELTGDLGRLGSRENVTPGNRPQLTVTYVG